MSSSYDLNTPAPAAPGGGRARTGLSRPWTLTATAVSAELAGIFGLAGAIISFAAGKSMLRSELLHAFGGASPGGTGSLVDAAVDSAYSTLQSRAILALVAFAALTSLAVFALRGRTGVRIGLTVVLLIAAGIWLTNLRDGGVPGLIRTLDGAAMVLALAAIVLAWLPASQRVRP